MNSNKWALGVAILALVLGGVALFDKGADMVPVHDSKDASLGGMYQEYNHMWFQRGITVGNTSQFSVATDGSLTSTGALTGATFTQGGGVKSLSVAGATAALVAADFDVENVIKVTSASTSVTVSLPASSTLSAMIPNAGDTREIWLYNASTSANAMLTVAGNTGVLMKKAASTTDLLIGDTDGLNNFRILLQRVTTGGNILMDIVKHQD